MLLDPAGYLGRVLWHGGTHAAPSTEHEDSYTDTHLQMTLQSDLMCLRFEFRQDSLGDGSFVCDVRADLCVDRGAAYQSPKWPRDPSRSTADEMACFARWGSNTNAQCDGRRTRSQRSNESQLGNKVGILG